MLTRQATIAALIGFLAGLSASIAQTCPLPPADCAGALYCGGEWDFEAGYYFSSHFLAGQCAGPPGGNTSCVPNDKLAHVANGWQHWASFPTWPTSGYWGTVAFNENKNCDNVYRGNRSQELTMTCANGVGVIYKQANVQIGRRIRVQAMMKFTPNGPAPDVEHALGIDAAGGTDPASSAIRWSLWSQPIPGAWNLAGVEAISTGPAVTVFIRQRAFEPQCEGQTFMVDTVRVFDDGPAAAAIEVAPAAFDFASPVEGDALSRSVAIRNAGIGTLSYSVAATAAWLAVSPESGTSTGETDSLTLSFDTDSFAVGLYEAAVIVTAPDAVNSPVVVPVTLRIVEKPGDFDGDRDVDQADFGIFQRCYSGSGTSQSDPACAGTDMDGDADVDAQDFTRFYGCFSGPGVPSNPFCAGG